jgi:hypothetical protein
VVASIIVIPSQGSRTTLLPFTRFVATLEFRLWVFHWVRFPDAALSKGSSAHADDLLLKAATSAPLEGGPMYAALRAIPIPDVVVTRQPKMPALPPTAESG